MKTSNAILCFGIMVGLLCVQTTSAMEIIFGRKYPIQQKVATGQLSWLSVQFEKDITGKVIYKLEASHPEGKKISYLKGRDYLLSEDIQTNMIRNFEIKVPEVEFDENQKAFFEVTLPYDFKTRYLPLKFETEKGYQEVVLRLRFGDYRFMLASRLLNTVSYTETEPVIAAKTVDQLFANREKLKRRPPKLIEKMEVAEVKVDDIYSVLSKDMNIQSRIITDEQKAMAAQAQAEAPDEFDSILSKYAIDEDKAKLAMDPAQGIKINPEQMRAVSSKNNYGNSGNLSDNSDLSAEQLEILNNPTTESDYNAYVDDLVKDKESKGFDAEASIDEIIAQAGQFDRAEQAANIAELNNNMDEEEDSVGDDSSDEALFNSLSTQSSASSSKPKKQAYVPPVNTDELFGLPSDNWVEPKSAPILVMKPKPINQKRRLASFEPPKRNNYIEMVPAPKAAPAKGLEMDDLFGGGAEANPSGFGF